MPFHPLKKCSTPTLGGNTKRVLVGIIALSSLRSLSQYFLVTEGGMWLCKIKVLKKEEKRKRASVLERKKNKRWPIPSCIKTISTLEKERHFPKEQCRIRISHYIFHTHALLDLRVCYSTPWNLSFDLAGYAR